MEKIKNPAHRGYREEDYPPQPTAATRYWRKNLIWQAIRFVALNLRIMSIVVKGHS